MLSRISIAVLLLALSCALADAATSEQTKTIAGELVCLCGDCNRESLATCQCGHAADRRAEIADALDGGGTGANIVAQFVQTYGQIVLATPPPTGYNLLAWITPFALMVLAAALLRLVLVNWKRAKVAESGAPPARPSTAVGDDNYQQQLREELRDRD